VRIATNKFNPRDVLISNKSKYWPLGRTKLPLRSATKNKVFFSRALFFAHFDSSHGGRKILLMLKCYLMLSDPRVPLPAPCSKSVTCLLRAVPSPSDDNSSVSGTRRSVVGAYMARWKRERGGPHRHVTRMRALAFLSRGAANRGSGSAQVEPVACALHSHRLQQPLQGGSLPTKCGS
jgi:hypothetical protein